MIEEGKFAVLIGPSGCGKTTTLKAVNRLIELNGGQIFINGTDITKANPVELRRTIGYVIQQIGLFPNMTVEQNYSGRAKLLKYDKEKMPGDRRQAVKLVHMPYEEYAKKISSRNYRRPACKGSVVLRALAASPPIVLMDEPFGALGSHDVGIFAGGSQKHSKGTGENDNLRHPRYGRSASDGGCDRFHERGNKLSKWRRRKRCSRTRRTTLSEASWDGFKKHAPERRSSHRILCALMY